MASALAAAAPASAQPSTLPAWAQPLHQPKRHALIIGLHRYQHARQLATPPNDIQAIRAVLADRLKFDTVEVMPGEGAATRGKLLQAVKQFALRIEPGDLAVVFFSGHGVEVDGVNYLVGTDGVAKPELPGLAWMSVDHVLGRMLEAKAAVAVLMLDACRADPFTGTDLEDRDVLTPGVPPVAISGAQGLAPAGTPTGPYLIAFAAQPMRAAFSRFSSEGGTAKSIYTRHLEQRLASHSPLPRALAQAGTDVRTATSGAQLPNKSDSLFWDLPIDGIESPAAEDRWQKIAGITAIGEQRKQLGEFLVDHPLSSHAAAAWARIASIEADEVASSAFIGGTGEPGGDQALLLGSLQSATRLGENGAVANSRLTLRARPKAGRSLGPIAAGSLVQLLNLRGGAAEVRTGDGRIGWIGGVRRADPSKVSLDVRLSFSGGDEYADVVNWTPLADAAQSLTPSSSAVTIRTGLGGTEEAAQARLAARMRALRIRDYVIRLGVPEGRVVMLPADPSTAPDTAAIAVVGVR